MSEEDQLKVLQNGLQEGRSEALAEAFSLYRDRLWRIAYFRLDTRLKSRIDPDDILQDAYMDALKRLPHYSSDKLFAPFVWLRLILGQTLINLHRKHIDAKLRDASRETSSSNGFPQSTSFSLTACLLGHLTSPSQSLIKSERAEKLKEAIDKMPLVDQETLAMRHFEELSNGEIAEVLGVSQKAASIRYVRAIARLKKILSDVPELSISLATK